MEITESEVLGRSVEMDSESDRKSREDWSPNGDVFSMLPVSPDAIRQAFMPPFEPGRSSLIQLPPGVPPFNPGETQPQDARLSFFFISYFLF